MTILFGAENFHDVEPVDTACCGPDADSSYEANGRNRKDVGRRIESARALNQAFQGPSGKNRSQKAAESSAKHTYKALAEKDHTETDRRGSQRQSHTHFMNSLRDGVRDDGVNSENRK